MGKMVSFAKPGHRLATPREVNATTQAALPLAILSRCPTYQWSDTRDTLATHLLPFLRALRLPFRGLGAPVAWQPTVSNHSRAYRRIGEEVATHRALSRADYGHINALL